MKKGTEITINIPFLYNIGDEGPASGNVLNTIDDCLAEVRLELEKDPPIASGAQLEVAPLRNEYLERVIDTLSRGTITKGAMMKLIKPGTVDTSVPQLLLDHILEAYPEFDTFNYVYDYRDNNFGKFANISEEIIQSLINSFKEQRNETV